jgi:hypothetical protein
LGVDAGEHDEVAFPAQGDKVPVVVQSRLPPPGVIQKKEHTGGAEDKQTIYPGVFLLRMGNFLLAKLRDRGRIQRQTGTRRVYEVTKIRRQSNFIALSRECLGGFGGL